VKVILVKILKCLDIKLHVRQIFIQSTTLKALGAVNVAAAFSRALLQQ